MKKFVGAVLVLMGVTGAFAESETIGGITWQYSIRGEGDDAYAVIEPGSTPISGTVIFPSVLGGRLVKAINEYAFSTVEVEEEMYSNITYDGSGATLVIPQSIQSIGRGVLARCGCTIIFGGAAPGGSWTEMFKCAYWDAPTKVYYPRKYAASYSGKVCDGNCSDLLSMSWPTIISATMRADDPTIMDVVYKVISTNAAVKVRMLAFENGERTFSKCVRPETFVEGTESNLGDAISANVEHKVSWKVSADYTKELAKLKVEMLVSDGDLLPLDLVDIPSNGTHSAMTVSCNPLTKAHFYNALFWLWADKTEGMMIDGGTLKFGGTVLAIDGIPFDAVDFYWGGNNFFWGAVSFVFDQMGYRLLDGDMLSHVNAVRRMELESRVVNDEECGKLVSLPSYAYKLK